MPAVIASSCRRGVRFGTERRGPASAAKGVYPYTTIHFGQSIVETTSDLVVMNGTEEVGRTPLGGLATDGRVVAAPR